VAGDERANRPGDTHPPRRQVGRDAGPAAGRRTSARHPRPGDRRAPRRDFPALPTAAGPARPCRRTRDARSRGTTDQCREVVHAQQPAADQIRAEPSGVDDHHRVSDSATSIHSAGDSSSCRITSPRSTSTIMRSASGFGSSRPAVAATAVAADSASVRRGLGPATGTTTADGQPPNGGATAGAAHAPAGRAVSDGTWVARRPRIQPTPTEPRPPRAAAEHRRQPAQRPRTSSGQHRLRERRCARAYISENSAHFFARRQKSAGATLPERTAAVLPLTIADQRRSRPRRPSLSATAESHGRDRSQHYQCGAGLMRNEKTRS